MNFIIEDNRIYASAEDGNVVAEITFPAKDGIATIDHTLLQTLCADRGLPVSLWKRLWQKFRLMEIKLPLLVPMR